MTCRRLQSSVWSVVAGFALSVGAYDTQAGAFYSGPVTVHEFNANLKGAFQDENSNGDDRIGTASANQKKLLEACIGEKLPKHEKVVMLTDCGGNSNRAWIVVVDTDVDPNSPANILYDIGFADFGEYARTENKDGDPTQIEYNFNGQLYCEDGSESYFFSVQGFAKTPRKPLDPKDSDSPICAQSANGKFLGTGDVGSDDVVLENGSFNAGPRSKKILMTTGEINDWID